MEQHANTAAMLVTCADAKVWPHVTHFFKEGRGLHLFLETIPGAALEIAKGGGPREHVLSHLRLINGAHPLKTVLLVNHSDCAAYRAAGHIFSSKEAERTFHDEQLRTAAEAVKQAIPGVEVETHFFDKEQQRLVY